jgi:hypothetical protein
MRASSPAARETYTQHDSLTEEGLTEYRKYDSYMVESAVSEVEVYEVDIGGQRGTIR